MSNRPYIDDIVSRNQSDRELREVFSDHFDDLTKPVSVSLGLYLKNQKVDEIVDILRSEGINAVPFYDSKVKEDLNCFVVDGSGIRTPFMQPKEAIEATADIFNIMKKNNIPTSRALPVMYENLISAVPRTYGNKQIDIAANNPTENNVDGFLAQQLKKAITDMQPISVTDKRDSGILYRGGTLGDKPFAMTFHSRRRDASYAAKDFATASSYANGERGIGLKYKEIEGKTYGFIYEYAEKAGQRFYGMAGVENPRGSEECKGLKENRDDYETLIIPERNPLNAIYLKVKDAKENVSTVVKIADKNSYISEEWKKFAQLHTPFNTNETNDYMVERMNKQIAEHPVTPYLRQTLEPNHCNPQIEGLFFSDSIIKNQAQENEINNARLLGVKLPQNIGDIRFTGDFYMENCTIQPKSKGLDLSKTTGIIGIANSDLSGVNNIKFPEKCNVFFLSNVKLAKNSVLDLSKINCNSLVLEDMNLANYKQIKLPPKAKIKIKGKTILPNKMTIKDVKIEMAKQRIKKRLQAKTPNSSTLGKDCIATKNKSANLISQRTGRTL